MCPTTTKVAQLLREKMKSVREIATSIGSRTFSKIKKLKTLKKKAKQI